MKVKRWKLVLLYEINVNVGDVVCFSAGWLPGISKYVKFQWNSPLVYSKKGLKFSLRLVHVVLKKNVLTFHPQ
jgi:hypothetical protein